MALILWPKILLVSLRHLTFLCIRSKGGAPIGAEGGNNPHLQKVGGLGCNHLTKKIDKDLEPHEKFVGFYAVVGTTGTLYTICYLYQRLLD